MPDPKDPKAQAAGEPSVEDVDDKNNEPAVTVDLNKPTSSPSSEPNKDDKDEKLLKMERRLEYQARQFEKGLRQMNDIVQNLSSVKSVQNQTPVSNEPDDLDKIAERDWKEAVSILAEKKAKKAIEDYENTRKQELEKEKVQIELSKSKGRVLERYPQLEDENSEEAQTYVQVLNENPNLISTPYGPELAMYRMEERLSKKGKQNTSDDIDKEVQRRARVNAAYVSSGTKPSSAPIVLTKAEQQYCDSHNLPYAEYAKMKSLDTTRLKEGVEVE